ncbi:transporter [candidate division KSB1 bacterium]|nr:transporter [candidate division KSB1 bacterium]
MNKLRKKLKVLGAAGLFQILATTVLAQGPPINTDTPIMLGLEGGGIRTFAKFVRRTTLLQDGDEIPDDMDRQVTVRLTPVAMPYNLFSDRFQIGVIVPFVNVDFESTVQDMSSFGIGDVRVFAKYLLYQRDRKKETFRVAAKAGIKFPTGDENRAPALGSGSTDYFFATVAGWIKNRIGIYLEGIYNLNTSHNQVDFGNSFAYNLAFGYRLLPAVYETYPSPQLNGFLEINGTTTAKSEVTKVTNENSGGATIFLSPGLQYVGGRRWLVEASLQIPVFNEPNGTQLATDWTVSIGTRILLF